MSKLEYIREKFKIEIGSPDVIVKVPGRANIIGEHIDYCGATVMPFAIEQSMYVVSRRRADDTLNAQALDISDSVSFSLDDDIQCTGWQSYIYTAINILFRDYNFNGADIWLISDIPIGAGLSSSSALCLGVIYTIDTLYGLGLSKMQMVDIASQAEHGMGIRGGIMDQYTILYGQKDKALLLDCNNETHTFIDLSTMPYQWLLINSNVKHNLSDTPYSDRRSQVEQALHIINKRTNAHKRFNDITEYDIRILDDEPILKRRINHIYTEILRVSEACNCIHHNDYNALGRILNASHRSLSQDYEVSCTELDFLFDMLQKYTTVIGCRMMGGGFGGSIIAIVEKDYDIEELKKNYTSRFGLGLSLIPAAASKGIELIK